MIQTTLTLEPSRTPVALLALCLLTSNFAACANEVLRAQSNTKDLCKANKLLNKGKVSSSVAILRRLVRGNPQSAQAHMQLGAALAYASDDNNYDEAIAEEQIALKLDPNSYGARKILGQIYANQKNAGESIRLLSEASKLNSASYAAQCDLGIALMNAGKNDDAIKAFNRAAQIEPGRVTAHLKLAQIHMNREDFQSAIDEAGRAVKLDISDPDTHLMLANARLAAGDKLGSIEDYQNALTANEEKRYRLAVTEASALSGLGWALSVDGASATKLNEAIAFQKQAIEICPPFGPAYIRLAELLSRIGKNKEAESVYKISLKYSDEDPGVATAYARFLARIGRESDACGTLKKVLKKSPGYKKALDALADLGRAS